MAKSRKSTKRRTTTKKLSAGEKELTAAEKKKVKGGGLNFTKITYAAAGNTVGGALGNEPQTTIGGAFGEDVIRTK